VELTLLLTPSPVRENTSDPLFVSNLLFPLIHILQEAVVKLASSGRSVPVIEISILEVALTVMKLDPVLAWKVSLTPSSKKRLNPLLLPNVYPLVSV
jgi:hypothetical protein